MSFEKKKYIKNVLNSYKENVLNSYRVEIKVVHGDGDLYEDIVLGPFSEKEFVTLVGIQSAIKEMFASDKETSNKQEYENLPYFRHYLMPNWKYDRFCLEIDIERFVSIKEYKFIYTDENGDEYKIENLSCADYPKYYYLKLYDEKKYTDIHLDCHDVLTTYSLLDEKVASDWGLVLLENGEEFLSKYYKKEKLDLDDLEDPTEFLIEEYFTIYFDDVESEYAFFDEIEKLENQHNTDK